MFGFSQDQITGTLRVLANSAITTLVASGVLSADLGPYVESAVVAVVFALAAWYFNRPSAQIAKTAGLEEVKSITVKSTVVADAAPANVKAG